MHRFILSAPKGTIIDHIDGDKLNNQRKNLRFCTPAQNSLNKLKYAGNTIYKGVHFNKQTHKYEAYIKWNKRKLHIGCFNDAKSAAIAWNKQAILLYGEFAKLNEVK